MRQIYRLNARKLASLKQPGRYADGGNLYLQVRPNGGRSWIVRYWSPAGKRREIGLGNVQAVSLAEAREQAGAAHALLRQGVDPLANKRTKRTVASKARTFGDYTEDFLKTSLTGLKNAKHKAQWESTLRTYAKSLWTIPLAEITTDDVFAVLNPIYETKTETCRRVRSRIEHILSAAKADRLRDGPNPAAWLDNLKPKFQNRAKKKEGNHAALPLQDVPSFMADLRKLNSVSARALEFTILTATRTNEVRGATWDELDLGKDKAWSIPESRMKAKREHRVPLCPRAIEILNKMKPEKLEGLIFAGARGAELSDQALLMCLRGLRPKATVHGFRSCFSDYIGDHTDYPRDLREFALAHKIRDETEAAYRRGDGFKKRREMMTDWASYLGGSL